MHRPLRRFKLKRTPRSGHVTWLNRNTVYDGKLLSMTGRLVRLYAPNHMEQQQHVDVSYDSVIPVR